MAAATHLLRAQLKGSHHSYDFVLVEILGIGQKKKKVPFRQNNTHRQSAEPKSGIFDLAPHEVVLSLQPRGRWFRTVQSGSSL